jgi:hypothetical protein
MLPRDPERAPSGCPVPVIYSDGDIGTKLDCRCGAKAPALPGLTARTTLRDSTQRMTA